MAQNRTAVRAAAPDRRPQPAATMPPRTVSPALTAPQRLQQRLGNQGTQALLSRTGTRAVPATGAGAAPPGAAAKAAPPTDKQAGTAAQQAPASKQPPKPGAPAPAADRPKAAPAAAEAKSAKPAAAGAPRPHNAIAPVAQAVHQRAAVARSHTPPHAAVGSAQAAAVNPVQEQRRDAATQTVGNLDAAKAEAVKRDDFKSRLKQAIEAATPKPKSESEAEKVMKTGATQASGALRGNLASERDAATGPLKSAAASEVPPASQPAPPKTELQTEPAGPPPAPVAAAPVVPAPLPPQRLDYSADRAPADQLMAQNKVSKEQLEKGNEPAFGPALAARGNAEKHEATAAARYRQSEGKLQAQTQATAQQALEKDLGGMHGARALKLGKVSAQQMSTMQKNAAERQRITDTVNGIKDKTRVAVETILNGMEDKAAKIFEDGLNRAEQAYEAAFSEAKGGIGTWLTTWGSDWDKHIEQSLATARAEYLKQVSVAIDQVADFVETTLKEAKQRVADGRKEVENFVKGLGDSVKRFGEEALQSVSADFDAMGSEIEQRRDGLIDKLVQQYKDSYERMSAAEEKLRDENKSLWQRAYDATVGLVKKIIEFKNMLLGVLARAAGVVEDIIADPIGFLGNLVSGVMQGLKNFMSKIGMHLQKGLMDWLFGALGGAGLQLPEKFDLQGIVSIILQVLGLTYANFRARAVAIVGEPVVAGLEKAAEVFKVIVTEGIPGLWRFIKEKLTDLKSMVLDAIWDFIKERVIIAGITWVIGLLNPASAFFKACKAIYDIVMFFINRGSQIMALVNAIIESMGAIAKGSLGVAATWIENALAKAIPVAIGFLAGLLGLGDISGTIKKTIDKAQAPINKAIDWVIRQAVKVVVGAGKLIKGLLGDKKDKAKTGPDERSASEKALDVDIAVEEATAMLEAKPDLDQKALGAVKQKYRLSVLEIRRVATGKDRVLEHVHGAASPGKDGKTIEVITRLPLVTIEFKLNIHNPNLNRKEYEHQLCDQAAGLNQSKYKEWKGRLDKFVKDARDPAGNVAQEKFRKETKASLVAERITLFEKNGQHKGKELEQATFEVENYLKGVAALHNPDQIVGGKPTEGLTIGSKYVNSSIGWAWKHGGKAKELISKVDEAAARIKSEPERQNALLHVSLELEK